MTETHGCGMLGSRPPASAPTPIQDPARQRLTRLGLALLATGAVALAVSATRGDPREDRGANPLSLSTTPSFTFSTPSASHSWHPSATRPGPAPAPGATSLLWPLFLAPFWKLGFRDVALVWPAWFFGWLALFGVCGRNLATGGAGCCPKESPSSPARVRSALVAWSGVQAAAWRSCPSPGGSW